MEKEPKPNKSFTVENQGFCGSGCLNSLSLSAAEIWANIIPHNIIT